MTAVLEKIRKIEDEMNDMFVERQDVIRGSIAALLSQKNILVLGAPGTSKSMLARELCSRIVGSKYYWYLMTKFTTPEEIFGPFSLQALKESRYTRITKNRLPEADIVFLDEIYKGSSAIQNTLLTAINERKFENDGNEIDIPLQTLFAASNEMPADAEELGAFHDRFHLKYEVRYIHERSGFVKMLRGRYNDSRFQTVADSEDRTTITFDELQTAQEEIIKLEMTEEIYELYDKIRFSLAHGGVVPSDRSFTVSQDVVKAEAWLLGQKEVIPEALAICSHMFWDDPKQQQEVKKTVLKAACKELLELESAYEQAKELIRPRVSQDDGGEVKENLEVRKKLRNITKTLKEGIAYAEKKGLPSYKYKSMFESVKNRLFQIESDMLGDDIDDILGEEVLDGAAKAE